MIKPCTECLIPQNPLMESLIAAGLFVYVILVVIATKWVYDYLTKRGVKPNIVIYFNRKLIHVFAGGLVALLVPLFFTSPTIPAILAIILAIMNYLPHKKGKLMYWFQVKENMYEVNFCIMWGVCALVAWTLLGSPIYALLPISFMAFGDAATGFVRNIIFRRRTKSWWGNLAMLATCLPLGYYLIGKWGIPIAFIASFIEHFEFNPIDDNVLISGTSLAYVLIVGHLFM